MQRITQWGEYGVHVSLFIARRESEGADIVTASEISDSQSLALNYTQQILVKLRAGGIIESERGPRGGYRLGKKPSEISLKDILLACEGDTMDIICETRPIDEGRCSPEASCWLRSVWFGLKQSIDKYLEGFTLDLLLEQMRSMDSSDMSHSHTIVQLPSSRKE